MKTDGKFIIDNTQGITQGIKQELDLSDEECKKLKDNSIWEEIIKEFEGEIDGQQNMTVTNNRGEQPNAGNKYKVHKDAVIQFSKKCWQKIVDMVNQALNKNIEIEETEITNSERNSKFKIQDSNQIPPSQPSSPEVRQVECTKTEQQKQEYMKIFNEAQKIVLNNQKMLGLSEKEVKLIENIKIESITYGPSRYDLEHKDIRFNINDFRTPDVNNFIILILHEAYHGEIDNYTRENAEEQEKQAETRGIKGARKLYEAGLIENFEVWGTKDEHKKIAELSDDATQIFVNKWFEEQYQHIHR